MSMIHYLRSRWTMIRAEYLFTDVVSGEPVYEFVDCYGHSWMATSKMGFRVRMRGGDVQIDS